MILVEWSEVIDFLKTIDINDYTKATEFRGKKDSIQVDLDIDKFSRDMLTWVGAEG